MSHPLLLTRRQVVVTLAGMVATLACGRRSSNAPVAIAYGRDECAWCRMPVDDPSLAAEWVGSDASPLVFGEPGCLLAWLAAHRPIDGTAWLRERGGDQWLRASDAIIAHGLAVTPMSFNLTAHGTAPAASTAVTLFTWSDLLAKGAPDARPS